MLCVCGSPNIPWLYSWWSCSVFTSLLSLPTPSRAMHAHRCRWPWGRAQHWCQLCQWWRSWNMLSQGNPPSKPFCTTSPVRVTPLPPSTPLQSPTWPADTNTVWMADHSPFFYKSLHMGIHSRSDKTQLHVLKSRHALRFSWQPASRFAGQLRRHRAAAIREASPGPLGWQGLRGQADWQTRPLCLPPHDPSAAGVQNPRRWNHRLCLRRTAPRCNTINWSMFYFMSVHTEVILDKPQKHHKWLTLAQVLLSACTEKHSQISELQTLLQTPTFRF